MGADDRGTIRAPCSTACSGSCAPALLGTICRVAIRPIRPVIAAFSSGSVLGCSLRLLQKLAEDLRDRGKLDLSEAFIDASFSSAKKGALPSALLDAVKAAKSWRSATAMVFLSPCTWPALRRMKPNSSKPPSSDDSFADLPNG